MLLEKKCEQAKPLILDISEPEVAKNDQLIFDKFCHELDVKVSIK